MSILKSVSNVTTYEYGFYGINTKHPKVYNCNSSLALEEVAKQIFWKNYNTEEGHMDAEIHFRIKGADKTHKYEVKTYCVVQGRFIDE